MAIDNLPHPEYFGMMDDLFMEDALLEKEEVRKEYARISAAIEEALLAAERQVQWAKYDAMKSNVRAACRRHLEIIRNEQTRADEELSTRRRTGVSQ